MSGTHIDISALDIHAFFADEEAAGWQGCTYGYKYKILRIFTNGEGYPWFEFQKDDGEIRRSSGCCFGYRNPVFDLDRKLVACLRSAGEDLEYPCGYLVRINGHKEMELRKILPVVPENPSDKLVTKL